MDGTAILGTRVADRSNRCRCTDGRHCEIEAPDVACWRTQEELNRKMADRMEISNDQKHQTYRARPEPGQLVEVRQRSLLERGTENKVSRSRPACKV